MSRTRTGLVVALLFTFAVINGCGVEDHMRHVDQNTDRMAEQLEGYQAYVKTLTEQLKSMAQTLSAFERMGSPIFAALMESMFRSKPPATTPDIDDVLGGGGNGAPAPSGPTGATGSGSP